MQPLSRAEILSWLKEEDPSRLEELWKLADQTRREYVGDGVHLRGLIEISSHCARECAYCGLHSSNKTLTRYRMNAGEILESARKARDFGFGTVVMQSGEDFGLTQDFISGVVRRIKAETPLAVTLSLGERTDLDFAAWKKAGADRYLIRFETSDPELYSLIHPNLGSSPSDRFAILRKLRELGYEIGSGVMVGIPGQSYETLARDIEIFSEMDLDMIGIGPYIPHPNTALGCGKLRPACAGGQVPNTELMTYKAVALTRLMRPDANIPSTSALATVNKANGRELGLMRGANVFMPNVTPLQYRRLYEIYPAKACVSETPETCFSCLSARLSTIGRSVGQGQGGRLERIRSYP
jgi:biotin synthase